MLLTRFLVKHKPLITGAIRNNSGFHENVKHMKIILCDKGHCLAKLTIKEDDLNPMGRMHGGLVATLVDDISSYGMMTVTKWREPSATVSINVSYMKPAELGEEITIKSTLLKVGKNMAYLEVELRNAENELLAKAEHIKRNYVAL